MDRSSNKRASSSRFVTPRKAYSVALNDAAPKGDQNTQFCNRIGCSGRIKYNQIAKTGSSEKPKCTKPSPRSSNGNEMTKKPPTSNSITTITKRSYVDSTRKVSSQLKFDPSESSLSTESERSLTGYHSSVSRPSRSSVPQASRSSALRPLNKNGNGSVSGLRNLKCNSISDVVRPRCSSSLESESVGKNLMMKKKSFEAESSSSQRGRKTAAAYVSPSNSGVNRASRMRLSSPQNGRKSSSVRETALGISRNLNSEREFATSVSSSGSRSFSRNSGENRSSRARFSEPGFPHGYNMDGIAEVLLALERIEQDEELTHEQFLALETSLFLSGLNLYDQHRDMRLDIDNMSYEELLALEERMGTVSTALSDEALSKCVSTSIYQETPSKVQITESGDHGDDNKCSICQEEYVIGDEIGKLVECQHGYHVQCVNQWLRLKNWCPICKGAAAPSQSSSSL